MEEDYLALHSTMLLLYLGYAVSSRSSLNDFTVHYASTISRMDKKFAKYMNYFTFHYASTISVYALNVRNVLSYLYIPLCFYYIDSPCMLRTFHDHFTFHYASTISVLSDFLIRHSVYFTFHYASTISYLFIIYLLFYAPLHSTMLLLYPFAKILSQLICHSFTFHYASTISNKELRRPSE